MDGAGQTRMLEVQETIVIVALETGGVSNHIEIIYMHALTECVNDEAYTHKSTGDVMDVFCGNRDHGECESDAPAAINHYWHQPCNFAAKPFEDAFYDMRRKLFCRDDVPHTSLAPRSSNARITAGVIILRWMTNTEAQPFPLLQDSQGH